MSEYIEVRTTIDSREGAQRIVEALLSQRLAACVQISGPIVSTYWWQGKIETAEEWVCTAKTRQAIYQDVEAAIKAVHPYDVPEILATKDVYGNQAYFSWVDEETKDAKLIMPQS